MISVKGLVFPVAFIHHPENAKQEKKKKKEHQKTPKTYKKSE